VAADGEEIVIAKAGKPRAPLAGGASDAEAPVDPEVARARCVVAADFDAPLPPDVLAAFTGR